MLSARAWAVYEVIVLYMIMGGDNAWTCHSIPISYNKIASSKRKLGFASAMLLL